MKPDHIQCDAQICLGDILQKFPDLFQSLSRQRFGISFQHNPNFLDLELSLVPFLLGGKNKNPIVRCSNYAPSPRSGVA
jgi:hypothetical protein